jgi:acyl-CoA thioester hydrolase
MSRHALRSARPVTSSLLDPEKATSNVSVRVRFGETDLMGIVHHGNYVLYFEAARVAWMRRRGVTYQRWSDAGIHLPVVDMAIAYKRPARFEDELIVETRLSKVTAATLTFEYRILRDGELLTTGMTRLACVGQDHSVRRIPQEMKTVLVLAEDSRLTSSQ